jgi:hypothetical protein
METEEQLDGVHGNPNRDRNYRAVKGLPEACKGTHPSSELLGPLTLALILGSYLAGSPLNKATQLLRFPKSQPIARSV